VRGGAAVALSSYFLFAVGFFSNLVLTRLLAPSDFGIFALGTFFFALLNLRPKLGIDQAFGQSPVTDQESSGTFAVLSVSAGIASLGLTAIAIPVLIAFQYGDSVIIATLALATVGMMDSIMGIAWVQLDKGLAFTRVSLVTAIAFPLSYLPAFYLAFNHGGYWALLAQNATYAVLLLAGLWIVARRELPYFRVRHWRFSKSLATHFVRFGVLVGIATIFATVVYQFDNFLVGTLVNVEALGYYDRAYRIAQWSSILVGSVLTRTAFYAYSRLQNDMVRLTKTASMSLWIVTTLALPLALAIFLSADELILFLFGEKWLPSAALLKFLVVYSFFRPLMDDAQSLFIAVGQPRRTTTITIVQAIVLVLAATPLTIPLGAVGAALGVGISFAVGLAVTYYYVRRTLPSLDLREAFQVPVIAAVVAFSLAMPLSSLVSAQGIPTAVALFVKTSITIAIYLGVTLVLRPAVTRERVRYVLGLLRGDSAT
jgi:PST family polysaccharide transporter